MNIAIIPARSGSKRIPRKNIKTFCGKPIIAYAINAAKESGLFEYIVVSTDDEEIAQIAREYGALTPFMRPSKLADDYTKTASVISHAINSCQAFGWKFNQVCCIYPSVPFIQIDDLKTTFKLLISNNDAKYSFPITEYSSPIQRALTLSSNGEIKPFYPEFELNRTQDLVPAYFDVGQFYWGKTETWLTNSKIHVDGLGYIIPNWRVVDIDTLEDWQRAEFIYRAINNSSESI